MLARCRKSSSCTFLKKLDVFFKLPTSFPPSLTFPSVLVFLIFPSCSSYSSCKTGALSGMFPCQLPSVKGGQTRVCDATGSPLRRCRVPLPLSLFSRADHAKCTPPLFKNRSIDKQYYDDDYFGILVSRILPLSQYAGYSGEKFFCLRNGTRVVYSQWVFLS